MTKETNTELLLIGYACSEIQGDRIMREKWQPFFFLPLFGFVDPESIPALPTDYGVPA